MHHTGTSLLTHLHALFSQWGTSQTYWVAYSGGVDSHVLLALCHQLRPELGLKLHAVHINHGMSPQASWWETHCAHVCMQWDIAFSSHRLQLQTTTNLEALAREQRYALFGTLLAPGDILLTAHQQDDVAETVLLQLLRGAGPKGLAAMPLIKPFAAGQHARPLLDFPRKTLLHAGQQRQLAWIDDPSNDQTQFARNFIRHQVLPLLTSRWPSTVSTIAQSAQHCAEADNLLDSFVQGQYQHLIAGNELSVSHLLQLSPATQRLVLRHWMVKQHVPLPGLQQMLAIQKEILQAGHDRLPCVTWHGAEMRRYHDHLYLLCPPLAHCKQRVQQTYHWDFTYPLVLPNLGTLYAFPVHGEGISHTIRQVQIRFRQGGETLYVAGCGHKILKHLFQEWHIVPWERYRIPLIFYANELVAVVGHAISPHFIAKSGQDGWKIHCQRAS